MSAYELQEDDVALSLALVVAGVQVRYVSHDGWPALAGYTDHKAIIGASAMGGTLGILGGAAEYRSVELTLATLGQHAVSADDPGIVFGRTDWRDCSTVARLITTLEEETGTAAVEIDRDPAIFGATPYYVHVGREAILVTGTAGVGTLADPWRFTLGSRGQLRTLPQQHYVHAVTPMRPWVTSEPFAWAWRRAWLYARARRGDGSFGDLVLAMPGFLAGAPDIDSGQVVLELLPLTAVLDKKLAGNGGKVRLLQNYHYFADGIACTVEHAQVAWPGALYQEEVQGAGVVDAVASAALTATTVAYDATSDVTLPLEHPRHTRLDFNVDRGVSPINPHIGAGQFQLAPGLPRIQPTVAGDLVLSSGSTELHQVDLITPPEVGTTGLLRWPEDALDTITTAWTPGTYLGAAGAWLDVKIAHDAERGPHLHVKMNPEGRVGPFFLHFWSGGWDPSWGERPQDWSSGAPVPSVSGIGRRRLHYGLDFADPEDDRYPYSLLAYDSNGGAHWGRQIMIQRDSALRDLYLPIRGWASAFYQSGERYLLVDTDVPVPPAGSVTLAIAYTPRGGGERRTVACRIISSTAVGTGYALEISAEDRDILPSFGDWGDGEPVEITPSVRFRDSRDGFLLLELLHSSGGGGVTDPIFDVHAFGGGLATDDVDQPSMTRHATPPGLDRWSPWVQPGATLREVIDPILLATGSALVMRRTAAGGAALARASMGLETAAGVADHLDTWETARPPANAPDRVVTNVYRLFVNHSDGGLGDAEGTLEYTDAASVAAHGDGEVLELELRGLYTDPRDPAETIATFRDAVARWSAIAGSPRVRWVGRVPIGGVWTLDLGSEVMVTSPHLRGRGVTWGVTGLVGRIVHISIPLWSDEATAEVAIVHYGNNSVRWNAALEVIAAPAVDEVEVQANTFAPSLHPITGEALEDLDGYSVGDAVRVLPRYDHDAAVALTITAIDRTTRRVTLSGAHGLVGPDWGYVEPATYALASTATPPSGAAHKNLAYLADASGLLNGGTEDGHDLT